MRRVVFNKKGGVGKSTIVCNLAAISAASGRRTLVVDLDPQGNTSHHLAGAEAPQPGVVEFFEQTLAFRLFREAPERFIHATPHDGLWLLPAGPGMEELQGKLAAHHKIYKLRELLQGLTGFDEVWIDTPPALGFYTLAALIAAERCLIPFDCDAFSRSALYALLDTVREVQEDHNPGLQVEGIVVNQFQARANLPRQLVEELSGEGLPVLSPFLRASVKVRESHQAGRPLVHLAPGHPLAGDFRSLHAALQKGAKRKPAGRRATAGR